MHRDEAHRRIPLDDRLGPVAVVHVPIHDEHLAPPEVLRVARGERDVIEEAKPHGPIRQGVVAGRPRHAEGRPSVPHDPALHGREGHTGGSECRLPAAGPEHGVRIQGAAAPRRQRLEGVEVAGLVHALQRLARRRRPLDPLDRDRERRRPQRVQHRGHPLRSLRMPRAGLMQTTRGVPDDGRGHAVSCGSAPGAGGPGWIRLRTSWRGGPRRLLPSRGDSGATPR